MPRLLLALTLVLMGCAESAELASADLVVDETLPTSVDDRVLWRSEPSQLAPGTDERPTYAMEARSPHGVIASPGRVLGGALVPGGVVWVLPDGALVRDDGSVIDAHVIPELAVSHDGRWLAYARSIVDGGGVRVLDLRSGARHLVTESLATADRPLFVDDTRLIVVGARSSGIAGVWIVSMDGSTGPLAVTNGTLRTGRPLGSQFVPPPAFHASMRLENGALVYDDGRVMRRVALPEAS